MVFRDIKVNNDERVDDLQCGNLFILQKKDGYCFSSDAVLLANFVKCHHLDDVVDMCSGCGVVGILIAEKQKPKSVSLVEIQTEFAEMAERSIKICGLEKVVTSYNSRVQDTSNFIKDKSVEVVVVNPPYYRIGQGKVSEDKSINIARQEVEIKLEEIISEASRMLKNGGDLYMVHLTDRFSEIVELLKKYQMSAKEACFIYPKEGKDSNVFLIRAKKGQCKTIKILPPIINH